MINPSELRLGNLILYKTGTRIIPVPVDFSHLEMMGKDLSVFFPIMLKPEWFEKAGFIENKKYALLPDAREFICTLPIQGSQENEICGYMKNNKECFARATVNKLPVSGNIFHVHGLQNLYHALTGKELIINNEKA